MNVYGANIAARRRPVAPDKAQQLLAAVNLARIAHQKLQKVKFFRGQIDLAGSDKDPAAVRIQRQIARLDDFLCLLRLLSRFLGVAAQDRLDARLYFQNVKWLRDIIIGAVFQPQNLIHIVAFCGQHNDRHLRELPDCLADFKSVQLRQHHVQKNHIILRLLRHLKRFLPVIGAGNFKSILFQTETDSFYY